MIRVARSSIVRPRQALLGSGAAALNNGATQALAGSIELANGLGSAHAPVSAGLPSLKQLAGLTASTSSAVAGLQGEARGAAGEIASATEALRGMTSGKNDARNKVTTAVPVINQGGLNVVVTALNLNVKTIGKGKQAFITAGKCTGGKFVVGSGFVYQTGATLSISSSSKCSK